MPAGDFRLENTLKLPKIYVIKGPVCQFVMSLASEEMNINQPVVELRRPDIFLLVCILTSYFFNFLLFTSSSHNVIHVWLSYDFTEIDQNLTYRVAVLLVQANEVQYLQAF